MNELKDNIKIDLSRLVSEVCPCGSKYFQVIYEIKHVPAILSPTGQAGTITIQRYKCNNCGKILGDEVTN